ALPDLLGTQLVHAQGRSHDTTAGVGDLQAFEQTLQAAVLSATPVQGNEYPVGALGDQTLDQIGPRINTERIHTGALQGSQHRCAGFERYLPLGRGATVEYRDTSKVFNVDHQA